MIDRKIPHFSTTIRSTSTKGPVKIADWLLLFLLIVVVIPVTALSGENNRNLNNTITIEKMSHPQFPPDVLKEMSGLPGPASTGPGWDSG